MDRQFSSEFIIKDFVTNEEVRAKIQKAIGPRDDLLTTAVVWSCLPLIRSGQSHLARHSERGKKTSQTEEEVGRQARLQEIFEPRNTIYSL